MKHVSKHVALLVSLLAAIRIITEELVRSGFGENIGADRDWLSPVMDVILTPLPVSSIGLLAGSLGVLIILLFLGRTKKKSSTQIPLAPITPIEKPHKEPQLTSPSPSKENFATLKDRVEKEWNNLEEADKETIRELVVQGGLWESDIIALLKTRGLLYGMARYDSLADRVSFVQCDYAGYYSIFPEYHSLVEAILAADYAEEVQETYQ